MFNCSDKQLSLPLDKQASGAEFPPRIVHADKTYFLLAIDVGPNRLSASKEKPGNRQEVTRETLISGTKETS